MTQKELDVFIEHLVQVWKPSHVRAWQFWYYDHPGHPRHDFDYAINGYLELKERLEIVFNGSRWTLQYLDKERRLLGGLSVYLKEGNIGSRWDPIPRVLSETDAQFINADGHINSEWRLIFRRNCWLSGANIECTAEEKAEWVKGYTYRQIDEWNSVLMGEERHLRF